MTATPARRLDRAVVLLYHRIGDAANEWEHKLAVRPAAFAAQMRRLSDQGYRACSVDAFVNWLEGKGELPAGSFLLTFDDGFLDVHEHARPVLRDLGWPATVFLVARCVGERDLWTAGENPSGRTHPLLGPGEIREMAREGFSFQSHSLSHADLTTLSDERLDEELAGARRDLERLVGTPVAHLAYPYGRYDERVREAAIRSGYRAAFTVQPGFNRCGLDPFRIRRLDVFGWDTPSTLLRKIRLGSNDGSLVASARYALRRARTRLVTARR